MHNLISDVVGRRRTRNASLRGKRAIIQVQIVCCNLSTDCTPLHLPESSLTVRLLSFNTFHKHKSNFSEIAYLSANVLHISS